MKNAEILVEEVFLKYRDTIDEMIEQIMYASDTDEELEMKKDTFIKKMEKVVCKWKKETERDNFEDNAKKLLKEEIYSKKNLVMKIHKLK